MATRLRPTAIATAKLPCRTYAHTITIAPSITPKAMPAIASRRTTQKARPGRIASTFKLRITTVEDWAPTFPPVPISSGMKLERATFKKSS